MLAKLPALSFRLGHVSNNHAFGTLTCGCFPNGRAFGALINVLLICQLLGFEPTASGTKAGKTAFDI